MKLLNNSCLFIASENLLIFLWRFQICKYHKHDSFKIRWYKQL